MPRNTGQHVKWTSETAFLQGDEFFGDLCRAVERARSTLRLETYIFADDRQGDRVLQSLAKAARRGVDARLLVDGAGSFGVARRIQARARALGIRCRIYRPLKSWLGGYFSFVRARNHRKVCAIDGRIAFVGGMNVCEAHLVEWSGDRAWRDTGVRVEGEQVEALESAFDRAWKARGRPRASRRGPPMATVDAPLVRLGDSRRARMRNHLELVERIYRARERVWLATPYFVPELALSRAISTAAWAGADVRLLFPSRNDVFFMRWVNRAFYAFLLSAGARVYEYEPSFLHSKIAWVDDWLTVGSANLNRRSLRRDLEVSVELEREGSRATIARGFHADFAHSREIRRKDLGGWRILERILTRFLLLARDWM